VKYGDPEMLFQAFWGEILQNSEDIKYIKDMIFLNCMEKSVHGNKLHACVENSS
jgi:hypothetical protein